jgi:hypothetical protein
MRAFRRWLSPEISNPAKTGQLQTRRLHLHVDAGRGMPMLMLITGTHTVRRSIRLLATLLLIPMRTNAQTSEGICDMFKRR